MTADELAAFLAEVRAECDERLAMLAAVDPQTLPLELRDEVRLGAAQLDCVA